MNFISPEPGGWNILHPQFVLGETEAGTTRNPEWVELIRKEPVLFYPGYSIRGKSGSTHSGVEGFLRCLVPGCAGGDKN